MPHIHTTCTHTYVHTNTQFGGNTIKTATQLFESAGLPSSVGRWEGGREGGRREGGRGRGRERVVANTQTRKERIESGVTVVHVGSYKCRNTV